MKATVATVKGFIKKNREKLLVLVKAEFDGMVDGQVCTGNVDFKPAASASHEEHTCGVQGVWLVGRGRDYVTAFEKNGLKGFEVSNSCGSFVVAVQV